MQPCWWTKRTFEFHGETVVCDIDSFDNLFVTRTFSKAYGLAGLRIGILAGPRPQMPRVRRVSSPYSVMAVALAVLPAALADSDHISCYVGASEEWTPAGARRVGRARTPQLAQPGKLSSGQDWGEASRVRVGHAQRAVLVRDRSSDPGCAGCVRITIGSEVQTTQLIAALGEVVRELELGREVTA